MNDIAETAWPMMTSTPKIDEYHSGMSDIPQSIRANDVVRK